MFTEAATWATWGASTHNVVEDHRLLVAVPASTTSNGLAGAAVHGSQNTAWMLCQAEWDPRPYMLTARDCWWEQADECELRQQCSDKPKTPL